MKQRSILWQAAGFAAVTLGGTLLHFLYDWTGGNILVSPFSGVNESTWEHMKLLFWPEFFFALIQGVFFTDQKNYWCIKLAEVLLGLMLIPVLFYTCSGMFGQGSHWGNIAVFYISAAGAFLLEWRLFQKNTPPCTHPYLSFAALVLMGALFVIFTFSPPEIPLFRDPLTGSYGL